MFYLYIERNSNW